MADKPMLSFHFDCGDSGVGPVGFCARVHAVSKEQAVEILNECLPHDGEEEIHMPVEDISGELFKSDHSGRPRYSKVDYVTVYFGKITIDMIDEVNCIECGNQVTEENPHCEECANNKPVGENTDTDEGE